MVRPQMLLHPQREPAPLRPAATVLLLRDAFGGGGIEVLMTRRSATASFAPGAYVFPGGMIDDADAKPATHAVAARRPDQDDLRLTQALAAIRESFEEVGVLLARRADGRPAGEDDIVALDRATLPPGRPGAAAFFERCRAKGLTLAADAVFTLAHWITDRDLPKRFDVPFLAARMPPGQQPVADEAEQFAPEWVRPADALTRHAAGAFSMIFPTVRTLERLAQWPTVDALLDACAGGDPLWTSCPRAGFLNGAESRHMEHEPPYGELELVSPDGQIVHALDWRHEPVALLRHVRRLTAPNPGRMTGPGTNGYLVGDVAAGWTVIDPGPHDDAHLARLFDAATDEAGAPGHIVRILCTHSHPDHSPGARPLQALCVAAGRDAPPVLGLPSAPTAREHSRFTPDVSLSFSEHSRSGLPGLSGDLIAIHTPGHAANHVCFVHVQDGLLFSGDHILNGSTTVIDPPDGDMTAYLDSLDRLMGACREHDVRFILPAHGHVIGDASGAIAKLKAHRLRRERIVIDAMRAQPRGSLEDWLAASYADTPRPLWPVAMRSLIAHVARIETLGLA